MAIQTIVTPVPGTFYRRPSPDSEPFKSEGDEVAPGDVIGLVEIMKNFLDVEAEVRGRVVEFHVENESSVTAGQPIASVEDGE